MEIDEDAVLRYAKHEAARSVKSTEEVADQQRALYHAFPPAKDFNFDPMHSAYVGVPVSSLLDRQKAQPTAGQYLVGDRVRATAQISPKIPEGTRGRVARVREDINEIVVEWFNPGQPKPFTKTTGSPSRGISREEES